MGRTPGAKNKVKESAVKLDGFNITSINGNTRFFTRVSSNKLYQFANGQQLEVINPRYFNADNGGHRIICADGTCFYIKPDLGWFVTWINWTEEVDENYRF